MKKIFSILICVACLCLSACGVNNKEDILEKLRDANLNSALQEKGQMVAFTTDIHDADGKLDSSYTYLDSDRVVYEAADRTEINEKGDIYGFDNVEKNIYRYLFLDDCAKEYMVEVTGYTWNPDETVLSLTKKNGNLIVRAQDGGEDSLANMGAMMTYYGYDVPDSFTITNEYILNSKTYEIQNYNVYANFGDKEFLLIECKRVSNPEAYKVDSKIIDAIHAKDSRVITIIADPGTEKETVYKQTIAKGCIIKLGCSLEHSTFYTDKACTKEYTGGASLNEDLTLYTIQN